MTAKLAEERGLLQRKGFPESYDVRRLVTELGPIWNAFLRGQVTLALVMGLIVGVVESLSGFYLPEGFKDIAAYVVVLVMLIVRPNGLFGEKLRKKV